MTRLIIENALPLDPSRGRVGSRISVDQGRIVEFRAGSTTGSSKDTTVVDGGGRLLTPGMIDVHIHGVGEHLFETGPQSLIEGLDILPSFGVTSVLPTMYTVMLPDRLDELAALAAALEDVTSVNVPGFHLEGPFLKLPGAGADTLDGDVSLLADILAAAEGRVAAMSVSPDTANILPVIERLVEERIAVFLTHTRASVDQTQAAIDAGARHATHFYDVFPLPPETNPGVRPAGAVETILADPRVSVDFICDGVHVHPMAIKAARAAKGPGGILLITDANIGAGMPPGTYDTSWGYPVKVSPGDGARIVLPGDPRHGGLAGSSLTMDVGINNLLSWLDVPDHEVWAMGTQNVARMLGLADRGSLLPGVSADLVLWDRADDGKLRAAQTWVEGRCVFDRNREGVMR